MTNLGANKTKKLLLITEEEVFDRLVDKNHPFRVLLVEQV
jgi:hypothetical protein